MVDDAETLCARLDKLDRLVKLAQLNQSGDDRARMERSIQLVIRALQLVAQYRRRPQSARAERYMASGASIQPSGTAISRSLPSRAGWAGSETSGYNARAGAEGAMSRYKRIIGDTLRSHTRPAQETRIAVSILNRMLDLGRPESVRAA